MWFLPYTENLPSLTDLGQAIFEKLKSATNACLATFKGLKKACQRKAIRLWQYAKPKLDKLMQATLAIFAAANAFRMTVQFAPIVLSIITVLAAAPLFSFVLPQFLFAPSFLLPSLFGISIFAGYYKYTELVLRSKLDAQTENNRLAIEALSLQVQAGKESLEQLQASCQDLQQRVTVLEQNKVTLLPLQDLSLKKNLKENQALSLEPMLPLPALSSNAPPLLTAH